MFEKFKIAAAAMLKNFKWPYLNNRSSDPLYVCFRVFCSWTSDLMALFPVRKIHDGGRRHVEKNSNGHISASGRPIHFMFGSRVGFSRTADIMAVFPFR